MVSPTTNQYSEAPVKHSPLVFLVGEGYAQADELEKTLTENGYRVKVFTDAEQFSATCSAGATEHPVAVVMDVIIPDVEDRTIPVINSLALCNKNNIPVLVTSERNDLPARLSALRAGARRYLSKPVNTELVVELLDEITCRQPPLPHRVLLIDDDIESLSAYAAILNKAGLIVHKLSEPLNTLDVIEEFKPDIVVLTVHMPEISGLELAAILREEDTQLPIVFLSSESDEGQQLLGLNPGSGDFLTRPVDPSELVLTITARARKARDRKAIQHRLETNLFEREQEHIALNQHAITSVADKQGNIIYVNDKFCEISGYSSEELLGQNHRIVKSQLHPKTFYEELWRTISSGKTWVGEICNQSKDGHLYWVESTITPFLDDSGNSYQYVSIRTDITQIKESQQALEIHKERLRRGQIFANIGTWDWNIESGELFWSERIGPLFGYQEGELETSYENFLSAVHTEDRELVINAVNACVEDDAPYDIEHRVVWPDGTIRWLYERGAVVRDENGKPMQMLGVVQDIDDRKCAELALSESEQQLREAQSLAHIGSWQADLESGELTWTDEIYRIFGYDPGSFEPSVQAFHNAVHPDDLEKVKESERQAEKTGRHDVIHRVIQPNGALRHVHELAQAETDSSGKFVHLRGSVQDITDQVVSENKLRQSEERFSFAVEGAGDGIWDWDMRDGTMLLSANYEKMLGFERGELEPTIEAWSGSVHPDDLERIQVTLQYYLENKLPNYTVELRLHCKDDSYKWVLCRGTVVARDNDNNPIRMIGIHSDISQRKLADEALNRFKTTLDMTKDCVFMFEPASLKFFYVNQGAMNQFGYNNTELLNMTAVDIKPEYNETQFREMISPLIKGEEELITFETMYQHKDGHRIPVEISLQYIEPEDQEARFVAIVRNVTERKLILLKMEQQKKLLDMLHGATTSFVEKGDFSKAMNGMLDTLLELTGSEYGFTGEVLYDDDNKPYLKTHAITNIAWDADTRALYDEFSAKGFEFRNLDTLFGCVLASQQAVMSNDPASDPRAGGLPEGHPMMHSFLGVPIFYGNEMVGMYGVANRAQGYDEELQEFLRPFDATYGVITHSKRMLDMEERSRYALVEAKETAERANQAKSDFLSSMSHELRTPMNAILGFGQLLEYDKSLSGDQLENVNEIIRAGQHLLELINEVLDLSRVESGQIDLSLEPVEISPIIEDCLSLVRPLAEKRNIHLGHSGVKDKVLRADRTRFKQVLLNLLSNAIKYNREGGSVKLEAVRVDKDYMRLNVIDTGPGILEDNMEELFQPFNRLDAEDSDIEGTGIGLTITRRIVEMMGGTIGVRSEVGAGSTFWIELPLEYSPEMGEECGDMTSDSFTSIRSGSETQNTILYIEDNPSNLKLVTQILGLFKHVHLLTAHTPELGIELAMTRSPDLILLDINMPGMNGYQVLEILKTEKSLKDIPVIAVTAKAMPRDIEAGKAAGFTDYVTKPIDVENFLKLIERCLQTEGDS